MPTYIDIHDLPGAVTAEDLAKAHLADQQVQGKYGVEYHKYWVNRKNGKLFCMCTAPSAEAAAAVHQEAHGNTALKIIEVTADLVHGRVGPARTDGSRCSRTRYSALTCLMNISASLQPIRPIRPCWVIPSTNCGN